MAGRLATRHRTEASGHGEDGCPTKETKDVVRGIGFLLFGVTVEMTPETPGVGGRRGEWRRAYIVTEVTEFEAFAWLTWMCHCFPLTGNMELRGRRTRDRKEGGRANVR